MRERIRAMARAAGFVFLLGGLLLYGLCSKGFVYWSLYEPVVMASTMLGTILLIIGFFGDET